MQCVGLKSYRGKQSRGSGLEAGGHSHLILWLEKPSDVVDASVET